MLWNFDHFSNAMKNFAHWKKKNSFSNIDCHMDYQRLASCWANAQQIRKKIKNSFNDSTNLFYEIWFLDKNNLPSLDLCCNYFLQLHFYLKFKSNFTQNLMMWNKDVKYTWKISRKTIWITWKSLNMK
jgi:hypothetical protein